MGMFDQVRYVTTCKVCGAIMSDFQTKDMDCALDSYDPEEVDNFYSSCHKCKQYGVEFDRVKGNLYRETSIYKDKENEERIVDFRKEL